MNTIKGVVRNGRIEVTAPADWPEGCEVVIEPVSGEPALGMREEDWPTTPEGIAALLKRWDEHEPLEMTPEEQAEWEAARRARKEFEPVTSSLRGNRDTHRTGPGAAPG
jgi:hypothetical protein